MKITTTLAAAAALLLAACGGGGGSSSSTVPSGTPSPTGATPVPVSTAAATNLDGNGPAQVPASGGMDIFTEAAAGTTANTSNGGSGSPVDGVPCLQNLDNQSNLYHIHVHLSMFSSGSQLVIPQGIGLVNSGAVTGTSPNTFINTAGCVYTLHTHDRSGIIHIEAETNNVAPSTPYTLGELFDIWGQTLSTYSVAGISGTVGVYLTTTTADANGTNQPTAQPYLFMGDPRTIPLVDHQEITIEVNTPFAPIPRYTWPSYYG